MAYRTQRSARVRCSSYVASLVGASVLTAGAMAQPRFEVIDLQDLNNTFAGYLTAINSRGEVVGFADFDGEGDFSPTVWIDGRAHRLPILDGHTFGDAWGINTQGEVIGTSNRVEYVGDKIFIYPTAGIWHQSKFFVLADLLKRGTNLDLQALNDINDHNQIVGTGRDPDTKMPVAFLVKDRLLNLLPTLGGFSTDPTAINNEGVIVGQSWTTGGQDHAFILDADGMRDLGTFGGRDSRAMDINERDQIVGWSQSPSSPTLATLWENEIARNLGTLGGNQSHASAINNLGQIVGFSTDAQFNAHMFYWEDGEMYNIIDLIPDGLGYSGRANAADINDAGQAIGSIFRIDHDAPVVLTRVDLELSDPLPGRAGEMNRYDVSGAPPKARVLLAASLSEGMTTIPGCSGATVLLHRPQVVSRGTTDDMGNVSLDVFVPGGLSGTRVLTQAVVVKGCRVSNLSRYRF